MAYVAPTASTFKVRYPAFAAVSDALIGLVLADAARQTDDTWVADDRAPAEMLWTAHTLTTEGHGQGATMNKTGLKRVKIEGLEIERQAASGDATAGLKSTTYGAGFLDLLRRNFSGPVAV